MLKKINIFILVLIFFMMYVNIGFCYSDDSDNEITPFLTYISSYECSLDISNGNAECTSSIDGNSKVTSTKITMILQKLSSGSWINVATFNATGGNSCELERTYKISRGTYRLYCTFTANSETVTKKTASKTY